MIRVSETLEHPINGTIPPVDVRAHLRSVLAVPLWSKDPNVLTAAKALSWSRSSIYRAVDSGALPVIRTSASRYVVSTSVLLRLVDGENAA